LLGTFWCLLVILYHTSIIAWKLAYRSLSSKKGTGMNPTKVITTGVVAAAVMSIMGGFIGHVCFGAVLGSVYTKGE
jgi:hypothetical protein